MTVAPTPALRVMPAIAGAVAADPPYDGVAWHYGDPLREQRALSEGRGAVDLSRREVVRVTGPERLPWLHALTTQHVSGLVAGGSTQALVLDHRGHVQHAAHVVDDGESTWLIIEPDTASELVSYLTSMKFWTDVSIDDVTSDYAVVWEPVTGPSPGVLTWQSNDALGGRELLLPRADLLSHLQRGGAPAGLWAYDALRVAAKVPRLGVESDHRTIPHEVGWLETAVHLDKGCYRGQETVARVHNLGRPPRRLVLLHLDGSAERLPDPGTPVIHDGREIGFVGTGVRHWELGSIALAVIKRSTPADAPLSVGDVAALQD